MTIRQLPERPNLEQLKRQAKDLLRATRTGDAPALSRIRILPAYANAGDDELASEPLALHDAQSVIAREHGFASWRALREHVEEATLDLDHAVVRFVEAATDGRPDRAKRLLASHPALARASAHAALLLGDEEALAAELERDPSWATAPGGPRGWEPLHYVCHTSLREGPEVRVEGLVAIARRLLSMGADPNMRFPWKHHDVRRPVLWGATFVTRLLPLARLLLESGADPNDGVTLTLAAGGGDVDVLGLLSEHGADPNHPWATDGAAPLYSALSWADTAVGIRWLLDHGADPDPVFEANGEAPLHAVARRWDGDLADRLLDRGADPSRRRSDGRTPYALAELNGNREVAERLKARGGSVDLSDVDRLIAEASRGSRRAVDEMLAARPELRDEIGAEHYAPLRRAAERGDTAALSALLACGLDPDRGDEEIGKTALHSAAAAGRPEAVRVLLEHGASTAVRDREFHGQPLVWAAESSRNPYRDNTDYEAVARLLIDAGSPLDWEAGDEPAEGLVEILTRWRRDIAGKPVTG